MKTQLPDGLDVMQEALSIANIMALIEKTARWIAPGTFELLPIWFPEYSRRGHFYKGNWTAPLFNTNRLTKIAVHKQEGNTRANEALTRALGLTIRDRPNWSCCHIWGSDDLTYQTHNAVVQDPRFYSCLANMVLLPSPLKAFTDALIEVKIMLRVCAQNLYGWVCDHGSMEEARNAMNRFNDWEIYPKSWPTPDQPSLPLGTMPLNEQILKNIKNRRNQIAADLANAGEYYPRDSVLETLRYWRVNIGRENA